jgi:hypothetical protein
VTVRRLLAILAALAAAAAGWWLASRSPPRSDEALVRALFEDGARAAEERRVGDAVAGLSESFHGQSPGGRGLDKREVKRLLAAQVLGGAWLAVKVASCRVVVEGDAASSTLDLVLSRGGRGRALVDLLPGEASAVRIEARLAREPEGWRVAEARWSEISLVEALAGPNATPR